MNIALFTNSNIGIQIFNQLSVKHNLRIIITDNWFFSLLNKKLIKIPFYYYNKKDKEGLMQILNQFQIDLAITASFSILPKKIWSYPKLGTINIHYSLLYSYAGPNPVEWQLHNNEEYTGITILFIDNKIDAGKIIVQKKLKMPGSTSKKVYENLTKKMIPLLDQALIIINNYKNNIDDIPFIKSEYKYSYYSFYKK